MMHSILVILAFLLFVTVIEAGLLIELYDSLMKKNTEIKNNRMMLLISKAVPSGIDPPNPKMFEFEAYKSDKSANFIRDGNGRVVFRQFKRLRLGD
ncbi:hypothetical protein TELCIR_22395, partial [Teladorsagia circumcincta]